MSTQSVAVIAAWLVEGAVLSALLRDAGSGEHAESLEVAMSEVKAIVSRQAGTTVLSELMDGFADRLWSSEWPLAVGSREVH